MNFQKKMEIVRRMLQMLQNWDHFKMVFCIFCTFISLTRGRILKFYIKTEYSLQLKNVNISSAFKLLTYFIMLTLNGTWKKWKERIWSLYMLLFVLEVSLKWMLVEDLFQFFTVGFSKYTLLICICLETYMKLPLSCGELQVDILL